MKPEEISIDEQAEAFKALKRGEREKVQYQTVNGTWVQHDCGYVALATPIRLKPTPTYRPWTMAEVNVGTVVRDSREKTDVQTIISKNSRMVHVSKDGWITLDVLYRAFEQLDGSPCGELS